MQLIEHLNWRYATKKMDASKKVSDKDIAVVKESIQLAASSYGLQPYRVLEIKDPQLREELRPLSWNQSQVTEASHFFVFCNQMTVTDEDVDRLIQLKAEINQIDLDKISGYGDFIKGKLTEKTETDMFHWTAKQTYLALSNAMNACAELRIDCTPMEGFDTKAYNEKLGLTEEGLNACVLLAIGYRHQEDTAQHSKKVRKSLDDLFQEI